MKTQYLILVLLLAVSFFLHANDDEDYVDNLEKLGTIESNVLDFNIGSPVDTLSPEIQFKLGFLLGSRARLGFKGNFLNQLSDSEDYHNLSYADNNEGAAYYKKYEKKSSLFLWEDIKNELESYFSFRLTRDFHLGFQLGGGINYDHYEKILSEYEFYFNPDGTLNVHQPLDDDHTRSTQIQNGNILLKGGVAFNAEQNALRSLLFNSISASERVAFYINGKGNAEDLVSLHYLGLDSNGFLGEGKNYYSQEVYYQDNSQLAKSYALEADERFNYFSFINHGALNLELDLHEVINGLAYFERFRIYTGLQYHIGLKNYTDIYDQLSTIYYSDVYAHQTNDYNIQKTSYDMNYDLFTGLNLPVFIDFKPIKPLHFYLGYNWDFKSELREYTAQYSEDHLQNGTDQSFVDPLINVNSRDFTSKHTFHFSICHDFTKYLTLALGSEFSLEHNWKSNRFKMKNNTRHYADGSTARGPYAEISDVKNYDEALGDILAPAKRVDFLQTVQPFLRLEFEWVEDIFKLESCWKPTIQWQNQNLADTNMLNLANWEISAILKFSPGKIKKYRDKHKQPFLPGHSRQAKVDKLVILHTNDSHGHPLKFDHFPVKGAGGLPARKTLIERYRKEYMNILVLDAGDLNTGRPESNFFQAIPDIIGYNEIGYDAMTLGNHEFDVSPEVLKKQQKKANFPFLSANIKTKDGKYAFTPYIIKRMKGFKVAVFGLTTRQTLQQGSAKNFEGLSFEDEVESAKKMISELSEKADVIIALCHLGIYEDENKGAKRLAKETNGIDLIIDGHSHSYLKEPLLVNNVSIVQAWQWGLAVGKAVININKKKVNSVKWELLPVNSILPNQQEEKINQDQKRIEEDAALLKALEKYRLEVEQKLNEIIGKANDHFFNTEVRKGETALGCLVADSMYWRTKNEGCDFALQNGGGIRADIPAGEISKKKIYEVLPFDNTVMLLSLKGSQIQELFNHIASITPGSGAFPQVSQGLSFTLDTENDRCLDILIGGSPIDPQKTYKITTNSFLAEGGDGYTVFTKAESVSYTSAYQRDIFIDYIRHLGGEIKADRKGRIRLLKQEKAPAIDQETEKAS